MNKTATATPQNAAIVIFGIKLEIPMADNHMARHSGHFGRRVSTTIEAPDVPAANTRFLLFLPLTRFTQLYCLTNAATEICGHLIPVKSRTTICVYWSCMNTLPR